MDTFTLVLIVGGALLVVSMVVHEVRTRRKAGRLISQQASMDDHGVNTARFFNSTNVHGGVPGGIDGGGGAI